MLITHRGLSGPAILQTSSYWKPGREQPVVLNLVPEGEVTASLLKPASPRTLPALREALRRLLPNRLADRWLEIHIPASWTNVALRELEKQIHNWVVLPAGTEGYGKAEVTVGGVDTKRTIRKNNGKPKSARTVFHRRSRGRYRTPGRLQLSVGMGLRSLCRTGIVITRKGI